MSTPPYTSISIRLLTLVVDTFNRYSLLEYTVRSTRTEILSIDGASAMEGVVTALKQPSSVLDRPTPPGDHDESKTPPPTPPPHPIFDLVPSPSLRLSPPASPSPSMHISVEKSAGTSAGGVQTQKRKEAPTEERGRRHQLKSVEGGTN